ncbi:MAG: MBOAT family O-acyltransferase [Verrucomicrobiota bacterium]
MKFNSLVFALFFCAVMAVYYSPIAWRHKKVVLLVASYGFYASWNPPFVVLLWISTLVDWFVARRIAGADSIRAKRGFLGLSLLVNLGLLGYFKYAGFFAETAEATATIFGASFAIPNLEILLPVGISFYTFQTLSYTLDVYHGRLKPWNSFLDYALYVTFFPQLVAGPIVRAREFLPQCAAQPEFSWKNLDWGLALLVFGLFQKVVLADTLFAPFADEVFASAAAADTASAWAGTFAFAGQILCDFSGYSACAIGVALCMGFKLPENFRCPYAAVGFSDFWRRWHISLSSWLRDYLYIPLGGNRRGLARTLANLMVVMLLGGLWHGAAWTFVVWGALHGLFLIAERGIRSLKLRRLPPPFVSAQLTFLAVCIAWVFFRAETFADAYAIFSAMFGFGAETPLLSTMKLAQIFALIAGVNLFCFYFRDRSFRDFFLQLPALGRAVPMAIALFLVLTAPIQDRAFIYFQF